MATSKIILTFDFILEKGGNYQYFISLVTTTAILREVKHI